MNFYNLSAVVDHIIWVVESGIAKPHEIGIATPYAAQVYLYQDTFAKIRKMDPRIKMDQVQVGTTGMWVRSTTVGTTEWWQGKQAHYMIVDLVRARNDYGELGFMPDPRRLNVLLSRQRHALVIFGDKDCTKLLTTDPDQVKRRETENRQLDRTFQWLGKKGRRVNVHPDGLSQKYVKLSKISEDDTKDSEEALASEASGKLDTTKATGESSGWETTEATNDSTEWSKAARWPMSKKKTKRSEEEDEMNW